MSIPESQLETWSHQGAVTTAAATHESVRAALSAPGSPLLGRGFEVYLQGSYRNTTNIRGDSDVDLVCQLNDVFFPDLSALDAYQRHLYSQHFSDASYGWHEFRRDCLASLRAYYGLGAVIEGNKCLKLSGNPGRLPADVVVCLQFRKYVRFLSYSDQQYVEGIRFFTLPEGREIINYPKPHYDNGVAKNASGRTNGWYKPVVRMFKNARTYLAEHGDIPDDLAPSYFLECMLYNVRDWYFGQAYHASYDGIVQWLLAQGMQDFRCQNEQERLFGPSPEQWSVESAQAIVSRFYILWETWGG